MQGLRDAGKIPADLWQAYRNRALYVKEPTVAELKPQALNPGSIASEGPHESGASPDKLALQTESDDPEAFETQT